MTEFNKSSYEAVEELDPAELRAVEGGRTTVSEVTEANQAAGDGTGFFHAVYYLMFLK
jgi:hypothetical protein